MTPVLFHVQHLLGIGHVRRAGLIVRALRAAGLPVTVAMGGPADPFRDTFGDAEIVDLPALRAADAAFSGLVDHAGCPPGADLWARRRDRLMALLADRRPAVVMTETFPFGRNALAAEYEALLTAARTLSPRPAIVASVRDILVDKGDPAKRRRMIRRAKRWYDAVLVHGDPVLVDLTRTLPEASEIADRLTYTGYVAAPADASPAPPGGDGRDEVIVAAGGGAVGAPLMRAALAARPLSRAAGTLRWRLLAGPDMDAGDTARLCQDAGPWVIVEPARADYPALLARARLSVSQAGYNTLMDVLAARCRAVVVPFAGPTGAESEQPLRARLIAERRPLAVVAEADLDPPRLAAAIDAALDGPPPPPVAVDMDGAAATARHITVIAGRFSSTISAL